MNLSLALQTFMKICCKVWHSAITERNNPRAELNKTLQMYTWPQERLKPNCFLDGNSTAAFLYGEMGKQIERTLRKESRKTLLQKRSSPTTKTVLHQITHAKSHWSHILKQQSTKSKPPYDPDRYKVVVVTRHQITAICGDKRVARDAQK